MEGANDALLPLAFFIASKNLQRRDLSESQRGMIWEQIANMTDKDNQYTINRVEELGSPIGLPNKETPKIPKYSQADAAKKARVSVGKIKRAISSSTAIFAPSLPDLRFASVH